MKKVVGMILTATLITTLLAGCGSTNRSQSNSSGTSSDNITESVANTESNLDTANQGQQTDEALQNEVSELYVNFGESEYFTLHLNDSETAQRIAYYVGSESWQLPIYHYDDYENWEIMQYYDIPSRYDIPSNPETVTSEAAGTVYYSEPNRIVLYFGDGEVEAEYTPIGYFDMTDDLKSAIENNPVLEGWGNKLIHISAER
ncbi:hypothetical protein P261_02434 [Lachnospiraceae bacterium TWA4]|nr:hypothetical protein P261_02434 [Lachnospiraceae bacterium TWA4]